MTLDGCLFAVQARDPQAGASIERRLGRLEAFYRPLGGLGSSRRRVDALRLLFGVLDFDGHDRDQAAVSSWGGRLPAALEVPAALGRASDAELRTLPSAVAAIDVGDDRATLITGPVAPTMLYEASSAEATAWSTHAVACAYLARGEARIDPAALPEFIAAEFVGGDRSLVEGVRALPAATRVTVTANEVKRRSYWPASERWAVREGAELQAEAERALLSTLPAALAGASSPVLGLTGGADSRVAAVALRELGREFETMTFGEADWEDVQAARRLAQTLGVPHSFRELEWWDDEEALGRAGAQVRWSEGAIHIGFGRVTFAEEMDTWITGAGAETGRAFYHRHLEAPGEAPGDDELARAVTANLEPKLSRARPEAVMRFRERVGEWVAEARASGAAGWRTLDVLYGEQRLQRWGRAMLPQGPAPMVFGFAHPELQRALVSLPLDERRGDAFHRRFLARHAPEVALAPVPRAAGARRLAERLGPPAERLLRRAARRRPGRSPLESRWRERPRFRAWIADELLGAPPLLEGLGPDWVHRVREGFIAGDPELEAIALWASAPAALDQALAELNRKD